MESSLGHVFRALVMLACLALVPALAMYGKYIPDFYQSVVEAYKARTKKSPPPNGLTDAPPFGGSPTNPGGAGPATGTAPNAAVTPNRWSDSGQPARPLSDWQQPAHFDTSPNNLQQASFSSSPGGAAGSAANVPAAGNWNSGGQSSPASVSPAAFSAADPTAPAASGAPDACTVQFHRIEQRLRELGATYYLLEMWGPNADRYRFQCKMAIAGNSEHGPQRFFQATSTEPLRAMQDVLDQVEQWRGGRQP